MDLHEAPEPDWVVDEREGLKLNPFQRVAKWSRGWLTIANVVSPVGAALVVKGCNDIIRGEVRKGTLEVASGVFLDYVDGKLADLTRTKSPLGGIVDVFADKSGQAYMLRVGRKTDVMPKEQALAIGVEQGANAVLGGLGYAMGNRLRVGAVDKWTRGVVAAGFVAHGFAYDATGNTKLALETTADVLTGAGLALGAVSVAGYTDKFLNPQSPQPTA